VTAANPWTLTLREASDLTGASLRTLRRRLADGAFPNATKDAGPSGAWRVPVTDLEAAGLPVTLPRPTPDPVPTQDDARLADAEERARAAEERARNAEERARYAEGIAEERGKALDDARLALRALTAGVPPVPDPSATTTQTPRDHSQTQSARRPFLRGFFRRD
jgi:hypothetical protein